MYLDALSFLEDERDAWRPYEALLDLDDAALERPVGAAHGWSARDLMGHLAVGESAPTIERVDRDWDERGGEVVNDELLAAWARLPIDEVRQRFASVAGELRGYLTVVPETRWVKHPAHLASFLEETIEHYEDHRADLEAILVASHSS
jgi:hypothetical protein